eukprot:gene1541-1801_t
MVTLQLWDTSGQERFRSLEISYYRGADCCILVFDVTNEKSLEELKMWREDFIEKTNVQNPDQFPFVVLGNKVDDLEKRKVTEKAGHAFVKAIGGNIFYFETSAKDATNIEEAFQTVSRISLQSLVPNESKFNVVGDEGLVKMSKVVADFKEKQKVIYYPCAQEQLRDMCIDLFGKLDVKGLSTMDQAQKHVAQVVHKALLPSLIKKSPLSSDLIYAQPSWTNNDNKEITDYLAHIFDGFIVDMIDRLFEHRARHKQKWASGTNLRHVVTESVTLSAMFPHLATYRPNTGPRVQPKKVYFKGEDTTTNEQDN